MTDALRQTDLVLSYESTAILEALIAKKPVVLIDLFNDHHTNSIVTSQSVLWAKDADTVKKAIEDIRNQASVAKELNRHAQIFLKDIASIGLDQSSEKIVEALMCSTNKVVRK